MSNAKKVKQTATTDQFNVSSQEIVDVIVNDKAVIVFLQDGFKGVAVCGSKDTFDFSVGFQLAFLRAKALQVQAFIENLVNPK